MPETPTPLRTWLDALTADDLRDLVDDAMTRVDGLADWLDAQRIAASDDPADLLALVNRDLAPHRRFYDYRHANRYAAEAYDTVQLLADRAVDATPDLVRIIERAITLTTRASLRSDTSSGAHGDLVHTLLNAHATAVRAASLPQKDQTRLVKWLVTYRYGGTQDFFDPDIVAYAPGLSAKSIAQYRGAIDLSEYGRYPLQRLAVLDRDRDAIVAARGGEPHNAMVAASLVADLEEAGLHADAVAYARLGVDMDARGGDDTLVTFLVEDAASRGATDEAVALRRERFARFTTGSTFAALRRTAERFGVWDAERRSAEARLAAHDPDAFTRHLLGEHRDDEAWTFATEHLDPDRSDDLWLTLCERRAQTAPLDTLPVYRAVVQRTLVVTDKRNYRAAASQLRAMRDAASAAGPSGIAVFDTFMAQVADENRRRPTCMAVFRRAGLVG